MSNISTNINLSALKHTVKKMKTQAGVEIDCLVIPIALNKLIQGKEGAVYLSTIGFPLKEKRNDSPQTHIIKQSFPKEYFDTLTEEQKREFPILGNHVLYGEQAAVVNAMELDPLNEDGLPF